MGGTAPASLPHRVNGGSFLWVRLPSPLGSGGKVPLWFPPSGSVVRLVGGSPGQLCRPTGLRLGTPTAPPSAPHLRMLSASQASGCGPGHGVRAPSPSRASLRSLPQDPLSSLERELALQLQIAEAARRLCREENLGRQARRQRKLALLHEEKKLRELERCLGERRRHSGPPPATTLPLGRGEQLPGAPVLGVVGRGGRARGHCVAFGEHGLVSDAAFNVPNLLQLGNPLPGSTTTRSAPSVALRGLSRASLSPESLSPISLENISSASSSASTAHRQAPGSEGIPRADLEPIPKVYPTAVSQVCCPTSRPTGRWLLGSSSVQLP